MFWLYRDLKALCEINGEQIPINSIHYVDHKQGVNLSLHVTLPTLLENTEVTLKSEFDDGKETYIQICAELVVAANKLAEGTLTYTTHTHSSGNL